MCKDDPRGAEPGLPWLGDDPDPDETREWLDSLEDLLHRWGPDRVRQVLARLAGCAHQAGVQLPVAAVTPPVNSIPRELEPEYPGDLELEARLEGLLRWNAKAMVIRANKRHAGLGGHLATYASVATIFEVGLNHFWRAPSGDSGGDQLFLQGHASPGLYARAFLEGRLQERDLENFRQELAPGGGLPSYPHPWLMPDFWSFPTVSMGLSALGAIYQARFNRYLHNRGLKDTSASRVWCLLGDGEMDEPESVGALAIAARERLDNLIFLVNCNLQRLDGPVRGNASVVRELEGLFRGAGWNVIKVLWASEWDELFEKDEEGHLARRLSTIPDGELQRMAILDGASIRKELFDTPELQRLVEHLSDDQIKALRRGGHDPKKLHAAFKEATDGDHPGVPTAILAMTVKGWGMGAAGEALNVAHQAKAIAGEALVEFRRRFSIPVPEEKLEEYPFLRPPADAPELKYLKQRRAELGGPLPKRANLGKPIETPSLQELAEFTAGSGGREVSTTMAFVRMLGSLLKHPKIGKLVVPIIPDEARTFGMDALFRTYGIYSPVGQLYQPVDAQSLLYYKEAKDGQILEEGITEAGSTASFIAAGTAYATHGVPTIPFYTFYSMFGFQRVMDLVWAGCDQRARGFLMGATAGRTTLNGEGLQHEDGHSLLLASAIPVVRAYDPAFAYETAVIVQEGLRVMYAAEEPALYYITLYNENYAMPDMPAGVVEGIVRGMYGLRSQAPGKPRLPVKVQLFGSGPILPEVLRAQTILAEKFGLASDVWSVTSYQMLRREALETERWNRLHPDQPPRRSWVEQQLQGQQGPFVAASDYMKIVPAQIAEWVPGKLHVLGTDGFGRSDTRAALRNHFEISAEHVVAAALSALAREGKLGAAEVVKAMDQLGIARDKGDPARA